MFTQPCFIRKNTPELQRRLEELGYEPLQFCMGSECLFTTILNRANVSHSWAEPFFATETIDALSACGNACIDCGTNEALFLALSALRDDSDYMQWFVFFSKKSKLQDNIGSWFLCTGNNYIQWAKNQKPFYNSYVLAHKASLAELIEHFQSK